jgi:Spy/CpxP family protein refolding chaperone
MLKLVTRTLLGAALLVPLTALAAEPQAQSPMPAADASNTDAALAKFRDDMQAMRADIMAKGLTLSADEAAKFWPLFKQYQSEQNVVINGQIEAVKKYADRYQTLNATDAVAYVKALLDRDQKMDAMRIKWLQKFQSGGITGATAARAIQLDRRLSQLAQAQLSSEIPLVH